MLIKGFKIDEILTADDTLPAIKIHDVGDLSPGGFDIDGTFTSGQCFRWRMIRKGVFKGIVKNKAVRVSSPDRNSIIIENSTIEDFNDIWHSYFDLETDCNPITKMVTLDPFMQEATKAASGVRMLRQEFEETLFSYILSSQNNIPRIMGLVEKLCENFGEFIAPPKSKDLEGLSGFSFPSSKDLSEKFCTNQVQSCHNCSVKTLCAKSFAGYRCPFIAKTAHAITDGVFSLNPEDLSALTPLDARKQLCKLSGVGEKVADCTLLYSGIHRNICPIDVWVEKVVKAIYLDESATHRQIRSFTDSYFNGHAGYAQLWFFTYIRKNPEALKIAELRLSHNIHG